MPKLLAVSILLFLLLGAGYGLATIQAARSIPWDCSDWQAFAHDDRTTSILESLAENRGKTLYCGIDQSDTFSKAETWQAGKDRNERDDTVYFGERGQFRGFLASQEGWLTEGESGITGVSRDRIFEFPREEKRRVKRVKRFTVGSGDIATDTCMTDLQEGRQPGSLICSDWGTAGGAWSVETNARATARYESVGRSNPQSPQSWRLDREINTVTRTGEANHQADPSLARWQELLVAEATRVCRSRGARYVAGSAVSGPGHSREAGGGVFAHGGGLGWFYWNTDDGANYNYRARESRTWTATCKKTIRRTR